MSRMAKLYQGVRADQMFKILMRGKENIDSGNKNQKRTLPTSRSSNHLEKEPEVNIEQRQVSEKKRNICRSYSLSNIKKKKSLATQRRCSSVPPTIDVQYLQPSTTYNNNNAHSYGAPNQLVSEKDPEKYIEQPHVPKKRPNIGRSSSLSDIPKKNNLNSLATRCSSVPPTINVQYLQPSTTYTNNVYSYNTLNNESGSEDGDFSGADSDVTYCPSDDGVLSSNSSRDLRDEPSTSSGIFHGNINEGRKRKFRSDPNQWMKNKNKKLRMLGKEYLGFTKPKNRKLKQDKMRPSRRLGERCNSEFCKKSKVRNCDKLTDETRLEIHSSFWDNMNWDQRKVYVNGLVTRKATSRKTRDEASRREGTLEYHLLTTDGKPLQVCRTTFLNTLCLGSYTVQSWVKKARCGVIPSQEIQNTARVQTPRTGTQQKVLVACKFLDDIPKLPSHYARKESSKLYLEPVYRSLSDLYSRYKEYCSENDEPILCRFTFEKLFKDKNLSLYTLKKDMCDVCCGHAVGNINTSDYEHHIKRKNRARQEKENDKKKALTEGKFILLSMDLEAVKVCPYLTASALYFKTKLTCHNFTMYDLITHQSSCYWFDETCADLTASTFASFVIDYIEKYCLPRGMPIIIYSDGCTYQNRNNIMANALLNTSIEHNVTITQKYLEPGHTQMECDSVHAAIERKLKNREIHIPSDFITVTKEARKKPTPYEAIHVDHNLVKDYSDKSTWRYNSIRPGRKAGDPVVVDLRAIKYSPEGTISYKINFDDDWTELPIRPKKLSSVNNYTNLHTAPIPIASTKYNHLQQLKDVLPRDCHLFYDNLPYV